jgi:uncharacterized protein (TIGR03083 family)
VAQSDVWPAIHAERKALAGDLDGLSEDAWATPSLCAEWTVRDVLAHMTGTAKLTSGSFFPKLIGSGFSLGRLQAKAITEERGASPADTLARFKQEIDSSSGPPGPRDTMLGETVVHAEDIRRPLGLKHPYPTDEVVRVADFYKNSNLVLGTKRRIAGLSLEATDADWRHGTGPSVSGPMLSLLMAMTGRQAALDDLSGDGVATLRTRA